MGMLLSPGDAETFGTGCEESSKGWWNPPLVNVKERQKMLRRLEKKEQILIRFFFLKN